VNLDQQFLNGWDWPILSSANVRRFRLKLIVVNEISDEDLRPEYLVYGTATHSQPIRVGGLSKG
jgi:hypothetical protein